jgi:hypothetical protein
MAKWLCVCGQVIRSSGNIPNPQEWLLLSDAEFEAFDQPIPTHELYLKARHVYRCPVSDHLWIFWDGPEGPPRLYAPAAFLPGFQWRFD